jgi:hypothetical protein
MSGRLKPFQFAVLRSLCYTRNTVVLNDPVVPDHWKEMKGIQVP